MEIEQFTPEQLSAVFGIVLSLLFSYVPKLKDKWAALDGDYKRVAMLIGLAVIAIVVFSLSCTVFKDNLPFVSSVSCSQTSAVDMFKVFIAAVIANQATFALSPQVKNG